MRFANHGRELKCKQNIFQPTLAVSAQHNERLRLKFITLCSVCTTIVLQIYMNPFEQPSEDDNFRHRYGSNLAAFHILFLSIFRIGLLVIVDKK